MLILNSITMDKWNPPPKKKRDQFRGYYPPVKYAHPVLSDSYTCALRIGVSLESSFYSRQCAYLLFIEEFIDKPQL